MALSMTGFARGEAADETASLEVAVRAVNGRFLDLKLRTPMELDGCEPMVRKIVKRRVRRGQLQINVQLSLETAETPTLDRELADAYLAAHKELAEGHGVSQEPDLTAVLRIPGVLSQTKQGDEEQRARLDALLTQALEEALSKFNVERRKEGESIAADVRARAETIAAETAQLEEAVSDLVPGFQKRLERRLTELLDDTAVEPQRLLQEAALIADKTDISEELQRLAAHAVRLRELLDDDGETGKQMDFLAQELNREANTLLSKTTPLGAKGLPVTEAGLRLKAEIEKIREQAQNLE